MKNAIIWTALDHAGIRLVEGAAIELMSIIGGLKYEVQHLFL